MHCSSSWAGHSVTKEKRARYKYVWKVRVVTEIRMSGNEVGSIDEVRGGKAFNVVQ